MKKLSIIVAVALLLVLAGALPVAAQGPAFSNAVFGGPTPWIEDLSTFYKSMASDIQAGNLPSRTLFLPDQISTWDVGTWYEGGMAYSVTTVAGLQVGDIVCKTYDQYDTPDYTSDPYNRFSGDSFCILIDDYVHNPVNDRIIDWLHYIIKETDGTYTLVSGQGVYWLVGDGQEQPSLAATIGTGLRMSEDYQVYSEATLANTTVSSRGYTSGTDVTSGTLIATQSFSNDQHVVNEAWVDDDFDASTAGWGETHFATIQEAIDAVLEGGTVHVADGTYSENPTMDKPLNLVGPADSSSATIEGTLTLASTADGALIDRINFLAVDSADNIVLQGVNGVTIVNCSFDGAGGFMSGGRAVQMSPKCSNVTIDNCTFQNGYYVTIQGIVDNLTVRNSTITNVKSGINLQSGNNLVVENTDVSVVAQGETNDTYCVRFSSNLPSVSTNMSIAGGTFSVNKNNIDAALGTYHSAIIVRSGAGGQLKANWLSIDGEVVNLSTTQLDATSNYWGPEGPDEPEGRVSGEVDTSNWLSPERVLTEYPEIDLPTLSLQAPVATGKTGLADVQVMLDPGDFEVFGFEFIVRYDADVLSAEPDDVQPGEVLKDMDQLDLESMSGEGGYTWIVQQPEAGKLYVRVTLLDDENDSIAGIMGTEAELAKVSFTAAATGDCADPSDVWLSDEILTQKQDGARIHPVTVGEPVAITAYKLVPVSGVVELQGRSSGKWNGVAVSLDGTDNGLFDYGTTTDSAGAWAAQVACGRYDVYVDMNAYLDAESKAADIMSAWDSMVKLLGGNANENTPHKIFLDDVVAIANVIGKAAEDMSSQNLYPDINDDGTINILDLVLAGINYTEEGPKGF